MKELDFMPFVDHNAYLLNTRRALPLFLFCKAATTNGRREEEEGKAEEGHEE